MLSTFFNLSIVVKKRKKEKQTEYTNDKDDTILFIRSSIYSGSRLTRNRDVFVFRCQHGRDNNDHTF